LERNRDNERKDLIEEEVSMKEIGGIPITRKITSMKDLYPYEQRRLRRLKDSHKREGIIPTGVSLQEMDYLLRIEKNRRRYRLRQERMASLIEMWRRAREEAKNPPRSISEILDLLNEKETPPSDEIDE
jgi:hypothetical protein